MRGRWLVALVAMTGGVAVLSARQAAPVAVSEADARSAAGRALALVQASVITFEKARPCVSCHHQALSLAGLRMARERGVSFDEAVARGPAERYARGLANLDRAVQAAGQIDPALDWGTSLAAIDDAGIDGNLTSAVYARLIAQRQEADGRWITTDARPPQSVSVFTATAFSARAVATYLPPELSKERDERLARARSWLMTTTPRNNEDRTFQLLGLAWTGASADQMRPHAERLIAEQRADGGWAQLPRLDSDAYATGQAVVALTRTGIPASNSAVRRALRYLLDRQQPDGSWMVNTRIVEQDLLSPQFFDSGFPHGTDQYASCSGTLWAAMALMSSLPVASPDGRVLPRQTVAAADELPWMRTALFGTTAELQALLDGGLSVNAKSAKGTTLLMMSAHDPSKAALLLSRGADVTAESELHHTALMVAANYRGSIATVQALLARGASAAAPASQPVGRVVSPLLYAVWSGDRDKVTLLLDRGADIRAKVSIGGGIFTATPLQLAIFQRDAAMVRLLASRGAPVDALGEAGATPLADAVFSNTPEIIATLISLGADVNQVDQQGETALMHAAMIDHGDTGVLEALLAAGARRDLVAPDKRTALAMAREYGHADHVRKLE
jgi:ankyrin repeat protein